MSALKIVRLLFRVGDRSLILSENKLMPGKNLRVALRRSMDTSTIVMMVAAVIALAVIYFKSPEAANKGLNATGSLMLEIAPRMIAAFTLAGLFQAVVPEEVILRWMGHGSGFRGILIGMSLGGISPGGPMTHFPVIASLFKMGVGIGPLVAYLSAWSLFGLQRVIMWEIPFLGAKVVAIRIAVSLLFPLVAGWLCELVWDKLHV
jgi:uncharacterized membrane protein YraQ (UPF0718 family)